MDTESLHTLSSALLGLGVVFTGVGGGFGLYYFSRAARDAEQAHCSAEAELRKKLAGLQKTNEELRERLQGAEQEHANEPGKPAADEPARSEPARIPANRPQPVPVKTPPPPGLVEWAGASILEEMIESSFAMEPPANDGLSDKQRLAITGILREYKGRSITIHSVSGNEKSFDFAWALKAIFLEAGWNVDGVELVPYANPPAGLFITSGTSSPPEDAIIPQEALTTAGFEVSRCVDSNLKSEKTVLLVGVGLK